MLLLPPQHLSRRVILSLHMDAAVTMNFPRTRQKKEAHDKNSAVSRLPAQTSRFAVKDN